MLPVERLGLVDSTKLVIGLVTGDESALRVIGAMQFFVGPVWSCAGATVVHPIWSNQEHKQHDFQEYCEPITPILNWK